MILNKNITYEFYRGKTVKLPSLTLRMHKCVEIWNAPRPTAAAINSKQPTAVRLHRR